MNRPHRNFMLVLLVLSVLYFAGFAQFLFVSAAGMEGIALSTGNPVGGDFINLWSIGNLVLNGQSNAIYLPEQLMGFQRTLINNSIGLRLWAYPPHSLLFAWPFGGIAYFASLGLWSVLGLGVLGWGARRIGFSWLQICLLVVSPAAMQCIYFGQSGNLATGLLLLVLAVRKQNDPLSISAAALLTIKPQFGFLLPVFWALSKKWILILLVSLATLTLVALSIVVFGPDVWRDYLGETVPVLSELEKNGSGSFMLMIPSAFMALRVLGWEGGAAMLVHLLLAVIVGGMLLYRLIKSSSNSQKVALILVGTSLITPYLHVYDLTLLLAGIFIMLRCTPPLKGVARIVVYGLALLVWSLPHLLFTFNAAGWPVGPIVIFALFVWIWGSPAKSMQVVENNSAD